ncbi:energy transducer TonB [Mucilaginibacter flavus]|uniref:energy transducer TonB n=1 Tax=Mucilaginibacter flavus TaxID=931504 RepID=UPI0025B460A6|nr:energy transducer TonB [Mucilaginibacter flavus]MDN3584077.1 TonB family protein [Mucilaginibacter flavus]
MLKTASIFLLGLMLVQSTKAQKLDTSIVYVKAIHSLNPNSGKIVRTRDSADFSVQIIAPPTNNSGIKLGYIKKYSIYNILLLSGTAEVIIYNANIVLNLHGQCTNYYQNGYKKNIINYQHNKEVGELITYYPNGQLCAKERYRQIGRLCLVEYHDNSGKVLTANGKGNWVKWDKEYKHKIEEGSVIDSLEEGKWNGYVNDSLKYTRMYHQGEVLPTSDTLGQVYVSPPKEPEFYGGMDAFFNFLANNIRYPLEARTNHIQGRVYVSFIIEKDGSLTNVKSIGGSKDNSLKNEAIRVVKYSPPWQPGIYNGLPVRTQYSIPITFKLGTN